MRLTHRRGAPGGAVSGRRAGAYVFLAAVSALALASSPAGTAGRGASAQGGLFPVAGASAAAFYNGPANCCEGSARLAVDSSGNAYVAGRSTTSRPQPSGPANEDIVVVKYDPQGNELWARRFDGERGSTDEPYDVAVDARGGVYVTGLSAGNESNFVTLKYDADGNFQWARYAGPSPSPGFSLGLALDLDAAGNVYATGREAYRFLAGGSTPVYRFRTVKYDTNGVEQWERTFDTPAGEGAEPADVKADAYGNVYVTGTGTVSRGATFNSDILTVKYDAAGNQKWARSYAAPSRDQAARLHVAAGGNVFVLGRLKVFSNADVALLVYTAAGVLARATSSSNFPDDEFAVEFAVDGAGNAYAAALLLHPPRDYGVRNIDALTYKFDAAGALAWRRAYANAGNNLDSAKGVVLDGAGGVHVGISAQQGSQANENYVVVKYSASDGAKLSEKSLEGPGRSFDRLSEIEIDPAGNLFLTGETDMDPATFRSVDFMTLKVGSAAPPSRPPARVNVAAAANGARATASSTLSVNRTPLAVINGDRRGLHWDSDPATGSGWTDATQGAFPDWLEVTFAGPRSISEVNVFTVQDAYAAPSAPTEAMTFTKYGATAYQVQYWTGSAWAPVPGASVTNNNRVWRRFTFAPLSTTKLRIVVTGGMTGASRLTEVEAF